MNWIKQGLLFSAENFSNDFYGAMIPTPVIISSNTVRIFFTFIDKNNIGRTGYVDLDINNLKTIQSYSLQPIFITGAPGTFDESGVLTCSVLKKNNNWLFYYVGFELLNSIRYRLLTGLSIIDDNMTCIKKQNVPILERTENHLYFRCGPFCIKENGIYRMWYVAGSSWTLINNKEYPVYEIYYIESLDGVLWNGEGIKCISIENEQEFGFGRPYVIKHSGIYKMFYSIRDKQKIYKLGYAESNDGINWVRKDNLLNLELSKSGWDSEMMCYSAVIEINNKLIMFYNGNNYGATGFGYAELTM